MLGSTSTSDGSGRLIPPSEDVRRRRPRAIRNGPAQFAPAGKM